MSDLKQYHKYRKQLSAEIKETKARLASLKKELKTLRENQQHQAVDHLEDYFEESEPGRFSIVRQFKKWLWG